MPWVALATDNFKDNIFEYCDSTEDPIAKILLTDETHRSMLRDLSTIRAEATDQK